MRRTPVPPTRHLRSAIREIDCVVFQLYGEQLDAYFAYVQAVSRGEKREIRKLFQSKFTRLADNSAMLEGKLSSKERRRAIRLCAYEEEMERLHASAQRLRLGLQAAYLRQSRFKHGVFDRDDRFEERSGKLKRRI